MRTSEKSSEEGFEAALSENDDSFEKENFRRTECNSDVKRSIEDYFERKKITALDDWYKDL